VRDLAVLLLHLLSTVARLVGPGAAAIVLRPSTLLSLHRTLTQRKYRRLFSSKLPSKPGPKGPSQEVIAAAGESAHVYNECPGYLPELGTPGFFAERRASRR
jgi:hypothetical protein